MSRQGTNPNDETAKPPMRNSATPAAATLSVEILQQPVSKLRHEADQSTKDQETEIRPEMIQAEHDLQAGMQDTSRSPNLDTVYRRQKK